MGDSGVAVWRGSGVVAALLVTCGISGLGGCTSTSYAGISLSPGATDPELQELARRARSGDKEAQVALGSRYEEGFGVPLDLDRAERLYRMAAKADGETLTIYSPPVGGEARGRIIRIPSARPQPGLPIAQERLAALQANRHAAHRAGSGMRTRSSTEWHQLPWTTGRVFSAILNNVSSTRPLDPQGIRRIIGEEVAASDVSVRIPAAYTTTVYSCQQDSRRALSRFLEPICAGADELLVHTYSMSPAPNPLADTRTAEMSEEEIRAQRAYLGEFLRTSQNRELEIFHLNQDEQFAAEMSGHFPFPLDARLVSAPQANRVVVIYSRTAQPDDQAGDEVQYIVVYSKR